MKISVPKETFVGEKRVALTPTMVERLIKKGAQVEIESGLGVACYFDDAAYQQVGATVTQDRKTLLGSGDIVVRVRKPDVSEVALLKKGALHVSYLDPFNEKDLVAAFAKAEVQAVSLEMIPRTTKAQKMDVLSSQASLAGYAAVLVAVENLQKVLPMMMTPAGTISPARVFIIGAGVAGLQAIATAKRLGARVDAFDTRPVVEEQVKSLGARFVKVDLGETGQTKDGYAKALTEEQLAKQREVMAKVCSQSDVVITTAQVFGRKAPVIITKAMVAGMKPGSVVVDLAVESGGNVEGVALDQTVELGGVKLVGLANILSRVSLDASQMFSANITYFLEEFWDIEKKAFVFDLENEILKGCLITYQGQIVNETIKNLSR